MAKIQSFFWKRKSRIARQMQPRSRFCQWKYRHSALIGFIFSGEWVWYHCTGLSFINGMEAASFGRQPEPRRRRAKDIAYSPTNDKRCIDPAFPIKLTCLLSPTYLLQYRANTGFSYSKSYIDNQRKQELQIRF